MPVPVGRRRRRGRLVSALLLATTGTLAGLSFVPAATVPASAANPPLTFAGATGQSRYPCGLLCVLSPEGTSLSLSGTGTLIVNPPGIMVDSATAPSVKLTSGGDVITPAGSVAVTGAASTFVRSTGSGSVGGQGTQVLGNVQPAPDPVAGLSGVAVPTLTGAPRSVVVTGSQAQTLAPGVYSTIAVTASAQLTLEPGPYVITQMFDVSGDGSVTGKGVTLYFACSSYPTPCRSGQRGASLEVSGNGLLYTTPPPDNASCVGLSVVFDPDNTGTISIPGAGSAAAPGSGAMRLDGVLYAPSASLDLTGSGSVAIGQVVVSSLRMTGSGLLLVPGTDLPPGPLGGLGGPDDCNLVFNPAGEPSAQVVSAPIAGGFAYDYLPTSSSPVVVVAEDGAGHVMTGFDGPVTMSLASGTGTSGANLGGTLTVDAVNGVAAFPGLSVDTAGTFYEMQASAASFNPGLSTGFNIYPNLGRCEVAPEGEAGDECSASASAFDGSETATITYVNQTPEPEWVLIGVTPTPFVDTCPHTTSGSADTVTTGIYSAVTGVEDFDSVATVDETVPAADVGPPPVNPSTGQAAYVVCFATTTPFVPEAGFGATGQEIGGATLEIGVLSTCGSSGSPPPPPLDGSGPPGPPPGGTAVGPPCTNFDQLNPDGSLSAEWLSEGDPVGRGG